MYFYSEYKLVPQEIAHTLSMTMAATFFGGVIGGITWSKNEYMHFMKTNYGTEYPSHLEAKRVMTHRLVSGMYRGFRAWVWRTTLLSLVFK